MSRIILFSFIIFAGMAVVHAQHSITLTFTANANGMHRPLDSVLVQNLTQGGDTMLYGLDTVLVLDQSTGTGDMLSSASNGLILSSIYPNPCSGAAGFWIEMPEHGRVTIRVFDLTGREHSQWSNELQPGIHRFSFQPGGASQYLLVAETLRHRQVGKVIHMGDARGNGHVEYIGWQAGSEHARTKGGDHFFWSPGDSLRYIGFASRYHGFPLHQILDDSPIVSSQYDFHLINGIPCIAEPFVTDIDGNVYRTVQIGPQCWFRENLRTTRYSDGTMIQNVTDNSVWNQLIDVGARCWYNNDSVTYAGLYGSLYNWFAVEGRGELAALCPSGWHVPSVADWMILTGVLGGDHAAGGKLKAEGTTQWNPPNTGATNQTGFTGLPAGMRKFGFFDYANYYTSFWTADELLQFVPKAYARDLGYDNILLHHHGLGYKQEGKSVRCVKY